MSDLFHDFSSIDYPIIDADAHVQEPPDLWQSRAPAKLRDRAPRVRHSEEGRCLDVRRGQAPAGRRA